MKYYSGLDVSMKETSICIVDTEGNVVFESTSPTDPKAIAKTLNRSNLPIEKVALETGSLSNWLTTQLLSLGLPAICVDARHLSAVLSTSINKTDRNDARGIAQAVRVGFIREVNLKPNEHIDIKNLISARKTLVEQRVKIKNTIRGLLKSFGIRISTCGTYTFVKSVRSFLSQLPQYSQIAIETCVSVFETLNDQIKEMEKTLKEIGSQDEDVKLLRTIPGVGLLTALSFKIVIGNPNRFSKSKNVGAYLGLTPKEYSSGETIRRGRISKCGHSQMRTLLVEAGMSMLTRSKVWSKPKAWALKIQRQKGLKKATTALGRKLAVIMHKMLLTREPFRYGEKKESLKAA